MKILTIIIIIIRICSFHFLITVCVIIYIYHIHKSYNIYDLAHGYGGQRTNFGGLFSLSTFLGAPEIKSGFPSKLPVELSQWPIIITTIICSAQWQGKGTEDWTKWAYFCHNRKTKLIWHLQSSKRVWKAKPEECETHASPFNPELGT